MNVLCMGETLLRYSTKKGYRLHDLCFDVHVGGSETNMAGSLARFGYPTKLFTKVSDNFLGDGIMQFLSSQCIDTSLIQRSQARVGSYYLENGSGNRTSQVVYDRAYSAMTTLTKEDVCIETLLKDIDIFITSGITVALTSEIKDIVIEMMKYCQAHHILVVYDANYRAKLWSIEEAGQAFKEILPYVDILSAGHLDAMNFLGLTSTQTNHEDILKELYDKMENLYPNIRYMTSTKRDIISTSVNDLTGYLYHQGKLYISDTYHIDDIVDRVGGGDAYFSGLLYALMEGKPLQEALAFGCGASVLKHTIHGDANQFSVKEIETFVKNGVSRILR